MTDQTASTPEANAGGEFTPHVFLYGGLRLDFAKEPVTELTWWDREGRKAKAPAMRFGWSAKTYRDMRPGFLYEIPAVDVEGAARLRFGHAKELGPAPDDAERQVIVAAHRATEAAIRAAKQRAKTATEDKDMAAILGPLITQYRGLRTVDQKIALEMLVLRALRGGAA